MPNSPGSKARSPLEVLFESIPSQGSIARSVQDVSLFYLLRGESCRALSPHRSKTPVQCTVGYLCWFAHTSGTISAVLIDA